MEGITRRIDELGRIVVPKEIRKVLRLSEGSILQFSVEDGRMILEKFSPLSGVAEVAESLAHALSHRLDTKVDVEDVSVTGADEPLKTDFCERMQREEQLDGDILLITPVICRGDILANFLLRTKHVTDEQRRYCAFAASVLAIYAEQ